MVLGKDSGLTRVFASIGLFGLIASFHGTILAGSRQIFAMARSGYLPATLASVNHRFKTPHWAIIAGGLVSFIAIFTGTTSQVIILSVLGAVVMYIISMVSLFVLRAKEPELHRPFKSPFYPWFPALALILCLVCLIAIVYYNPLLSLIFCMGLILSGIVFVLAGKHKAVLSEQMLVKGGKAI
jgi:ethanolamine permease